MIKIENLAKCYGKTKVLDKLNLEVKKGEVYGFIGQNGEGKSTTMNILTKIIKFQSGKCFVNDKDITKAPSNVNEIGYLPEDPKFYDYMSAKEYLFFIGTICKYTKAKINTKSENLLKVVKLDKVKSKPIGTFSRGMRQRLGIAVAIYNNPKTVILDEPSSALDPEGRKDIINIIENLKAEGKTVLISTHILNDIERICDRIGILKDGQIIIEDNLNNLIKKYMQPFYDLEFENPVNKEYIKRIQSLNYVESVEEKYTKISIRLINIQRDGLDLIKEIINLGIQPISINQRKSSLEDIFIKVAK